MKMSPKLVIQPGFAPIIEWRGFSNIDAQRQRLLILGWIAELETALDRLRDGLTLGQQTDPHAVHLEGVREAFNREAEAEVMKIQDPDWTEPSGAQPGRNQDVKKSTPVK